MTRVDWAELDAAAQGSMDRSAIEAAADAGIRRGVTVSTLRSLARRVLAVAVVVLLTGTAVVARAVLHEDPPPPGLTGLSPTSGSVAGGDVVTVRGAGLAGATAVLFGTSPATGFTVDSDTRITVTTPPGTPGTVPVTVTSPHWAAPVGPLTFTYVPEELPPPPVVLGVSPSSGASEGGDVVTIVGTGLAEVTAVRFGSVDATGLVVESDTRLTATTPPHEPGTVGVTVQAPSGASAAGAASFTYLDDRDPEPDPDPKPVLTAVRPSSGPAAGGQTVTILGSGFTGATEVTFGSTPAADLVVDDDTSITAVTPPGEPATVDVSVTTPAGTSVASSAARYTYTGTPPVVTSIQPTSECTNVEGDELVTIVGTDLGDVTDVRFGRSPADAVTVVSPTRITARAPAEGEVGEVQVTVTTPSGRSTPNASTTYVRIPCVE